MKSKCLCGQIGGEETEERRGEENEPGMCHMDEIEVSEGSWIQSDCVRIG